MSGFLYYLSGIKANPSQADLVACGLGKERLGGTCQTEIFLDGTRGTIFTIKGRCSQNIKIGFYSEDQVWTNIPNDQGEASNFWIGYYREFRPTPKDLEKKEMINGNEIELGDGNNWNIPVARNFHEGCLLPKGTSMLVKGKLSSYVLEKYFRLQKIAEQLFVHFGLDLNNEFKKDDDFLKDDTDFFITCADVLGVNYNIDFREISILRLFTTTNTVAILKNVVDMQYVESLLEDKKKSLELSE